MAQSSDPSDVVISNGTGTEVPGVSLSRQVADKMNDLLSADPRYAVSHQEPGESPALSGSTNTQGRYSNGSADPCEQPGFVVSPERFIHMEQDPDVRDLPASNWAFVIQTYNDLIDSFPAPQVVPKEDGSAVSEFPLDGDTLSATGQQDGVSSGSITASPNRFAIAGKALAFSDAGHVEIPDYPYAGTDSEFTLSFWFRATKTGTGGFQYLLSHGSVGRDGEVSIPDSLHVYLERNSGQLRIRYTTSDGTHWAISGPSSMNDDSWHFFALTHSQTAGTQVYVDGALEGTRADLALRGFDPEGPLVLGGRSDLSAARFLSANPGETGMLDNFIIHNTALSGEDILSLFNVVEGGSGVSEWIVY
jgi:hypothetical protein